MRAFKRTLLFLIVFAHNSYSQIIQPPKFSDPTCGEIIESTVSSERDQKLIDAIRKGDSALVDKLLECGVSPDSRGTDGDPALFWAVRVNRLDILSSLLRRGADIDKRADDGGTLLQTAAAAGRVETTRSILSLGADVNAKDAGGHTALMCAVLGGMVKAFPRSALKTLLPDLEDFSLAEVIGNKHDEVLMLLIRAGADINAQAEDCGLTALMMAAISGNAQFAALLLAAGADMSLKSGESNALQFALALDSAEKVEKELDDNFEREDEEGRRAFTGWVFLTEPGRARIAMMLRDGNR